MRCLAVLRMSSGLRLPVLSSGRRVSALSKGVTEWLVSGFSAFCARPRLGWSALAMFFLLFGVENIAKNASESTIVNPASNRKLLVRSSFSCCRLMLVLAAPCGERCMICRSWPPIVRLWLTHFCRLGFNLVLGLDVSVAALLWIGSPGSVSGIHGLNLLENC